MERLSSGRTPRWLAEEPPLNVAGEGPIILQLQPNHRIRVDEFEQKLASAKSVVEMRTAYVAACDEVRQLIKTDGEGKVWQRVSGPKKLSVNNSELRIVFQLKCLILLIPWQNMEGRYRGSTTFGCFRVNEGVPHGE